GTNTFALLSFRLRSIPSTLESALNLKVLGVYSATGEPITTGTGVESGIVTLLQRKITGDNNANDRLDVGDASAIMRLVTEIDPVRPWDVSANDLNDNKTLDAGDAIRVLRAAVNIDAQPTPATATVLKRQSLRAATVSTGALTLNSDKADLHPGEQLVVRVSL